MGSAVFIYLDYLHLTRKELAGKAIGGPVFKILFAILAILIGLLVGYSRLFLGVHSWNQVFFGWQMGIWLAFTLEFCIKDQLFIHLDKVLMGENTNFVKQALICTGLLCL